ncbi:hypothetical protein [Chromohalobacter israelensis]|uniref:hypothetical protein n=1 Tax=Chromohalobacter israelensis TaxID=141390 RepID=UPI000FFF47AA|nr:hypothetical protein [Chromohalobacter salexigens]RXE48973.1 hypothetical protein B4O83_13745 [Chromohalobacter salexigens]
MDKRLEQANCLTETECLLIDPRTDRDTLLHNAEIRLDAIKDLMFTLSTMNGRDNDLTSVDLSNLAMVSRLLIGDASDLLVAARGYKPRVISPDQDAGGGHV